MRLSFPTAQTQRPHAPRLSCCPQARHSRLSCRPQARHSRPPIAHKPAFRAPTRTDGLLYLTGGLSREVGLPPSADRPMVDALWQQMMEWWMTGARCHAPTATRPPPRARRHAPAATRPPTPPGDHTPVATCAARLSRSARPRRLPRCTAHVIGCEHRIESAPSAEFTATGLLPNTPYCVVTGGEPSKAGRMVRLRTFHGFSEWRGKWSDSDPVRWLRFDPTDHLWVALPPLLATHPPPSARGGARSYRPPLGGMAVPPSPLCHLAPLACHPLHPAVARSNPGCAGVDVTAAPVARIL